MDVVDEWTGRHASALRQALRLTNEGFAALLGTAVRTVAKWNADPAVIPVPELQRALDTVLYQASDDAKARFGLTLDRNSHSHAVVPRQVQAPSRDADIGRIEERLSNDPALSAAVAWLDRALDWPPGVARQRVVDHASATNRRTLADRAQRRATVGRSDIARSLASYYSSGMPSEYGRYAGGSGGAKAQTSILTRPDWLDCSLPLNLDRDGLKFRDVQAKLSLDVEGASSAIARLAVALVADLKLVNAPVYRLLNAEVSPNGIHGAIGIVDFLAYALTLDLLESELVDAIADEREVAPGALPLRDRYLRDVTSVLSLSDRICVGGPLALFAVARQPTRRNPADYVLLVQERSGRVLNSARRLAVIPKSFHEPLISRTEDVHLFLTLEREMEEELFGRADVDTALGESRQADPMHASRLSAPMRWLVDRIGTGQWAMELTGFGINLVSGNYEFASLIVVHDVEWWEQFGGHIEVNWESDGLQRYSTLDGEAVTALLNDPAWSNEGLFALLQGLRRLSEIGGERVEIPEIEWELH